MAENGRLLSIPYRVLDKVSLDGKFCRRSYLTSCSLVPVHCEVRTGTKPGTLVPYVFLSTVCASVSPLNSRLTIINWFTIINCNLRQEEYLDTWFFYNYFPPCLEIASPPIQFGPPSRPNSLGQSFRCFSFQIQASI